MTLARSQTVDPHQVQLMHIQCRVVRRAFLCGFDRQSNTDYEHRRGWIRQRLEKLAGIYAIDIATFAVLSNQYQLVVRTRPDIVAEMSDEAVVRQILKLQFNQWFRPDGSDRKRTRKEINRCLNDKKILQRYRLRLSNISKFMQSLNQSLAVKANREDGVKGRFLEARFGHTILADTPDVLGCELFVDLEPIEAAMAATPEEAEYTGAYERLCDLRIHRSQHQQRLELQLGCVGDETFSWERLGEGSSGWLAPVEFREDEGTPDADPGDRRASRMGVLPMSLLEYRELLQHVAGVIAGRRQVALPPNLPVLDRLGLTFDAVIDRVKAWDRLLRPWLEATDWKGRPELIPVLTTEVNSSGEATRVNSSGEPTKEKPPR